MTIYVLEVELVSSFSVLLHCLFYVFVFYFRSVGYIARYKFNLIFKIGRLKILIPRSRFNMFKR